MTGAFLPTAARGLRHLEHVMGMPVMFDVCDSDVGVEAIEHAVRWLHWVDATFSTYRADSEISRFNRDELGITDLHPEVRAVLRRCAELNTETFGFFNIQAPYSAGGAPAAGDGGPGSIDPSGLVKGWAVARAAEILSEAGARNFLINASGDIHASGCPDDEPAWRVGIQHPLLSREVAVTLALSDAAMATSGTQARGQHLIDPFNDAAPPAGLLCVTIVGPDIATVDAYATAAYAMGADRAATWCAQLEGYDAILIRDDATVLSTPGIARLRV